MQARNSYKSWNVSINTTRQRDNKSRKNIMENLPLLETEGKRIIADRGDPRFERNESERGQIPSFVLALRGSRSGRWRSPKPKPSLRNPNPRSSSNAVLGPADTTTPEVQSSIGVSFPWSYTIWKICLFCRRLARLSGFQGLLRADDQR